MSKGLTISGGALLGTGVGAAALFGTAHSDCNSTLGQIARGFSGSAAKTCAIDNLVFYLGIGLAVVGAVLLLAGLVSRSRHEEPWYPSGGLPIAPVSPPPGWYRDPRGSGSSQWWNGARWIFDQSPQSEAHG